MIKNLNLRPETTKLLEESKHRILFDTKYSNIFLHLSLKTKETKVKINKLDLNLNAFS